jgi:hypothetical protein
MAALNQGRDVQPEVQTVIIIYRILGILTVFLIKVLTENEPKNGKNDKSAMANPRLAKLYNAILLQFLKYLNFQAKLIKS